MLQQCSGSMWKHEVPKVMNIRRACNCSGPSSQCSAAQVQSVATQCLQLEDGGNANFALGVDVYFTCALSESDLLTQVRQQNS